MVGTDAACNCLSAGKAACGVIVPSANEGGTPQRDKAFGADRQVVPTHTRGFAEGALQRMFTSKSWPAAMYLHPAACPGLIAG